MRLLLPAALLAAALAAPAARAAEPTEWAARHVLVAWKGAERSRATRTKEEAAARAKDLCAALSAPGADFAAIAAASSDDQGSALQGGFLGFFARGLMTPKFQEAVERLREGEVSGVVESPFGFHVVQRLSREEGERLLHEHRAAIVLVVFPWKGLQGSSTTRPKDLALEDAARAAELLRAGTAASALPAELGAVPQKPGFQALVLPRGAVSPAFKAVGDQAFSLRPGEVGGPVETQVGWIVVQRVPYFRLRVQHLVVIYRGSAAGDASVTRTKAAAKARAEEALAKLEADPSSWAKVVAEYSDEAGAGPRQGDLGVVEPGQMVPSFDAGIARLAPGQRTQVFETEFGFHVARRVE